MCHNGHVLHSYRTLIAQRPERGRHGEKHCHGRTAGPGNYLRFQLSPKSAIALAARVKRDGKEFVGKQRELYLVDQQLGEESPYERLLGDATALST